MRIRNRRVMDCAGTNIDLNWYGISFLKMLGLAWDVKLPKLKEENEVPDTVAPARSRRGACAGLRRLGALAIMIHDRRPSSPRFFFVGYSSTTI